MGQKFTQNGPVCLADQCFVKIQDSLNVIDNNYLTAFQKLKLLTQVILPKYNYAPLVDQTEQ